MSKRRESNTTTSGHQPVTDAITNPRSAARLKRRMDMRSDERKKRATNRREPRCQRRPERRLEQNPPIPRSKGRSGGRVTRHEPGASLIATPGARETGTLRTPNPKGGRAGENRQLEVRGTAGSAWRWAPTRARGARRQRGEEQQHVQQRRTCAWLPYLVALLPEARMLTRVAVGYRYRVTNSAAVAPVP